MALHICMLESKSRYVNSRTQSLVSISILNLAQHLLSTCIFSIMRHDKVARDEMIFV